MGPNVVFRITTRIWNLLHAAFQGVHLFSLREKGTQSCLARGGHATPLTGRGARASSLLIPFTCPAIHGGRLGHVGSGGAGLPTRRRRGKPTLFLREAVGCEVPPWGCRRAWPGSACRQRPRREAAGTTTTTSRCPLCHAFSNVDVTQRLPARTSSARGSEHVGTY